MSFLGPRISPTAILIQVVTTVLGALTSGALDRRLSGVAVQYDLDAAPMTEIALIFPRAVPAGTMNWQRNAQCFANLCNAMASVTACRLLHDRTLRDQSL